MGSNHTAGSLDERVQRCVVCGMILVDYRRTVIFGEDKTESGFAEGPVNIIGNMTSAGYDSSLPDCSPNET